MLMKQHTQLCYTLFVLLQASHQLHDYMLFVWLSNRHIASRGWLPPTSLNPSEYTSSDGLLAMTVAGFDTWLLFDGK